MNQSCFLSGLQVPHLSSVGEAPSHPAFSLGAHGVLWHLPSLSSDCPVSLLPSTIPSCVCLCSVEHSLLIAEWLNSSPNPDTGGSTPEACRWEVASRWALPSCTWGRCPRRCPLGPPSIPQLAKQSLRPFCTICNRYFKTPRKFVEHVKSQGHKDKAKEVTPAPSEDRGPEHYGALAKATQQVEVYSRPNSQQGQRDWSSLGCEVVGVSHCGCPELT